MPIRIVACNCGSSEQVARRFLERAGYKDWMNAPIARGKEASRKIASSLSFFPEAQMLDNYLQGASKWVVIIGWNDKGCRWADLVHSPTKSEIEGQVIVETFA